MAPSKQSLVVGAVLLFVAVIVASIVFAPDPPTDRQARSERAAAATAASQAERERRLKALQEDGLLVRIDQTAGEALVARPRWDSANVDQKRSVIRLVSEYFAGAGSSDRVRVIDHQSGRTLAEYSARAGFSFR